MRPLGDCKGYNTTAYSCHAETIGTLVKDNAIGYDEIISALVAFKDRIFIEDHTCFQRFSWPAADVMSIILERAVINENELLDWITAFSTMEKTGDTLKDYWQYRTQSQVLWLTLWFTKSKFENKHADFISYVQSADLKLMEG